MTSHTVSSSGCHALEVHVRGEQDREDCQTSRHRGVTRQITSRHAPAEARKASIH